MAIETKYLRNADTITRLNRRITEADTAIERLSESVQRIEAKLASARSRRARFVTQMEGEMVKLRERPEPPTLPGGGPP